MINREETTDLTLFVRSGGQESDRWNRQRIIDALLRETDIDYETAETISREVERQIVSSGITRLTTALIRELVDARLVEKGLEHAHRQHTTLGFPLYDVRQLLLHANKENANVPHNPEGTNLILAEGIKRDYALHDVFSQDICDAHILGDIHLHGLGYIDRPHSSYHLLEYIKRFGLDLPGALNVAQPARHAEVLLAHMVRFSAVLQGLFGGLISWDLVNISLAPYICGMTAREVAQFAQMVIYEFSQLTSTRGGQTLFTDIHLYWDIPPGLAQTPAIGPGGVYTGKTYGEYEREAQDLAMAIFDVYKGGDARGRPFIFPRPLVHISEGFFRAQRQEEFLRHICAVAEEKGNTCFVFERQTAFDNPCLEAGGWFGGADPPIYSPRGAILHHVTINMPRLGYRAGGDEGKLFSLLDRQLELAVRAHREKGDFLKQILALGERGPLAALTMEREGVPYLNLKRASYLVGMVGLNELVLLLCRKDLSNGEAARFGLGIVKHMREKIEDLGGREGLKLALVQTEAETTAYRFARLDLKLFSPPAGNYVRGNIARGEIYYTNSTCLPVSSRLSWLEKTEREGLFHPLLEGGATTTLYLGNQRFSPEEVAEFIRRVFGKTSSRQVVLSPEFSICLSCGGTSRGMVESCPECKSSGMDVIARITQYFGRTSGWNRGKLAELRDRNRTSPIFPEN